MLPEIKKNTTKKAAQILTRQGLFCEHGECIGGKFNQA
jgi:hypothetical protein